MKVKTLTTVSKSGEHYGIINGLMTKTYPTEIDLVLFGLKPLGIDLKELKIIDSRQLDPLDLYSCITTWDV